MRHENGYWIDENGNRWNDYCSEERAKELSSSMINCYNCYNCRNCRNCCGCGNCRGCCGCCGCYNCYNCNNCSNCSNCCGCRNCRDCRDCYGYTENPALYRTDRIGSRNDQTTFYYGKTEEGMSLQVVCGCFCGDLKEFEATVLKTHANDEEYKIQYLKEIQKVKALFELEKVIHE